MTDDLARCASEIASARMMLPAPIPMRDFILYVWRTEPERIAPRAEVLRWIAEREAERGKKGKRG